MPIKYYCPKCEKRFVEWGAEKLEFQCPECVDERLLRMGAEEDPAASKRPSLKRVKRKAPPPVEAVATDSDGNDGDDDDIMSGDDGDADSLSDVESVADVDD